MACRLDGEIVIKAPQLITVFIYVCVGFFYAGTPHALNVKICAINIFEFQIVLKYF